MSREREWRVGVLCAGCNGGGWPMKRVWSFLGETERGHGMGGDSVAGVDGCGEKMCEREDR